jgi:glycosyltransferase involved in cell wall biosynthesis
LLSSPPIAFNGKFLSGSASGVHRVAEALITGVDAILQQQPAEARAKWELLTPPDAHRAPSLDVIQRRQVGVLTWQPWEQFELPWHARRHVLINLCNLAPLAAPHAITMIHDAQTFISPESYSRKFRSWYQFALPRIGASAARVLTVSEYSRQQLAHYGIAPLEKIEVLHNGVDHLEPAFQDPALLKRLGLQAGGYVVALANTQRHKNIGVLMQAFQAFDAAGPRLVLVGSHTADDFRKAGHEPGPHTIFAGRVSDAELGALYRDALCLALPSTTEGFGLPPLEAMRAGCPAVVAPCGALPEVCGDAALYAAPDNPAQWVEAIVKLSDGSDLRARMIAAGHQQTARFTWARSSGRLLEIIQAVAAERATMRG